MKLCKEHSVKSYLGCAVCWQKLVIAKYEADLAASQEKLAQEHENYLSAHRDNMQVNARNMDLKDALRCAKEALESMTEWIEAEKHPHLIDTDDNPGQYCRDALAFIYKVLGG